MRIRKIKIHHWRHFENVELELSNEAPLVCLVGANGTGKSHLLELIASCAHRLGLSQGIEIPRGDPFNDPHFFSLQFYLAKNVSDAVDVGLSSLPEFAQWDRTLTIQDRREDAGSSSQILAGGIVDQNQSMAFAQNVVDVLRQAQQVHFLSLDADRSYPKKNINFNEVAQAYEIDWDEIEYTRGRSYRPSSTLYDEWIKYFLAQENQSGTKLMQSMRRAKVRGETPPEFRDHFEPYTTALQIVLPHVRFSGVDSKKRTLLFDTTGLALAFDQLSGGEREIAFLVGQIDRFGLRQGLFLLDEPELHLNADLIRTWVGYLMSTVSSGQIWLATHSLEAVEAAGQQATFVLERNLETRQVDGLARLDTRPVLSVLSRAVGTPAFSISQLKFVFIEGEEGVGERERFRKLAGEQVDIRFMECGSCSEVVRRVEAIRSLAEESSTEIRVGGVVDRDFQSEAKASALKKEHGVLALPVHEVENFFLHTSTMLRLSRQNGSPNIDIAMVIREAADRRAGSWIFQRAMATDRAARLPPMQDGAKERAKSVCWAKLETEGETVLEEIACATGYSGRDREIFKKLLEITCRSYKCARKSSTLWKVCEGKQVLNMVAEKIGFADSQVMINAALSLWARESSAVPEELGSFREYLDTL